MSGLELLPALALAGTAVGAGTSIFQAQAQNKAASQSAASAKRAAAVQTQQVTDQAANEARQRTRQYQQLVGRLKTLNADAGLGFGGSLEDLVGQATLDNRENLSIVEQNRRNNILSISSGLDSNLAQINSRRTNALLAGLAGGVQGLQTGLALDQGLSQMGAASSSGIDLANQQVGVQTTKVFG